MIYNGLLAYGIMISICENVELHIASYMFARIVVIQTNTTD